MSKQNDQFADSLPRLLGRAGKAFKSQVHQLLDKKGYDLTAEQCVILMNIFQTEGLTQQQITDYFTFDGDKTRIMRVIDVLERQNLAVRVPDKNDRRQNMIFVTNEGKTRCGEIMSILNEVQKRATKGIPARNLKVCKDVLKQVYENLGLEDSEPK